VLVNNFDEAYQILEKYFCLFVEKQKKDGYQIQILIDELSKNEDDKDYFYVRFWKEDQQSKLYKIDY